MVPPTHPRFTILLIFGRLLCRCVREIGPYRCVFFFLFSFFFAGVMNVCDKKDPGRQGSDIEVGMMRCLA